MKNLYKMPFLLSLALFVSSAGFGQISFTDNTANLADPTHYSGNAVSINDVNGDGLDDIVLLDDASQVVIEFQQADGTWLIYSGGIMAGSNAWGMVVADLTNNGYSDIISGVNGDNPDYAQANNDGTEWTMQNIEGYPLFYQGSSMADIDQDGDLDLYVCADTDESAIWENDGDGNMIFSGTNLIDLTVDGWDGSGNYGSTFTDFDLDGDLDLYIAHCRQGVTDPNDPRRINQLFENDGNNNYTENAAAYGLASGEQSWTADFADIDNDGDFDIILTNHNVDNILLENLNDSDQYEDIHASAIGEQAVGFPIQAIFKDFDNDGFVDLMITGNSHALYHNNGDKTFTLVEDAFPGPAMLSMAIGDLNHDGFLDVYGSYGEIYNTPSDTPDRVWLNEGNDNNYLTVVLEGTISNVDAIGSQVRAYGPWGVQVREVRAGESYGINNSLHAHFGLGTFDMVDSLVIDWPSSGIHQVIENVPANQFLNVIENECIGANAVITADGPLYICPGESVTLDAGFDVSYTYLWSNGAETSSILVTESGSYTVAISTGEDGCSSISSATEVVMSPDETPSVSFTSATEFCEGESISLSASTADSYLWSNGQEEQTVVVTETGDFSVTIQGTCESFTSEVVSITVLPNADIVPDETMINIVSGESTTLMANTNGTEIRWYENETDVSPISTGASYITPSITANTTYWVEGANILGGGNAEGGKVENSIGDYHQVTQYFLIFDAYEDFILDEVTVYADEASPRIIQLRAENGELLESQTINVQAGESVLNLNMNVPAGIGHSLRIEGENGLWRDEDDNNVNFPYELSSLGAITGTNVSGENADVYYYYFYDWKLSLPSIACVSERESIVIDVTTGLFEGEEFGAISTFPNPTSGLVNIQFAKSINEPVMLTVLDINGKQIQQTKLYQVNAGDQQVIDLGTLSDGIYLLQVRSANGFRTERIELFR